MKRFNQSENKNVVKSDRDVDSDLILNRNESQQEGEPKSP
jgi:hypothetical protein